MPTVRVVHADALAAVRQLGADSIDSVVTDSPYGLTSRFSIRHSRFPGHRGRHQGKKGFLGHAWDASLPDPAIWSELLRVLKPGAHLVASGGSRTYHRLASAIESAGFVIRDMIQWTQTQGMPKCFDVARQIAKVDPDRARAWQGWQLNLKPAHEPIVLAQKPISERTIADNVLRWGTGALHVDACRSPFLDEEDRERYEENFSSTSVRYRSRGYNGIEGGQRPARSGRYPADVVLTDGAALGAGGHVFAIDDEAQNAVRARKASQLERTHSGRVDNNHPTVKPLRLIRWLVRLVTPTGGIVLDPFAGSGTAGLAAYAEGCSAILVENNLGYVEIARRRIELAVAETPTERSPWSNQ